MTTLDDVTRTASAFATELLVAQAAVFDTALLAQQSELEVTQVKLDAARVRIAELEAAVPPPLT